MSTPSAFGGQAQRQAALERMWTTASTDDGYREQLVVLADSHGGIYRQALEMLYAHERALDAEDHPNEGGRDQ